MTVLVPVVLAALALADAGFAGFRAATGRNARIRKRFYYRAAVLRGIVGGGIGLGVIAAVAVGALSLSAEPGARYAELVRSGGRMLAILAPFAGVVVMSLVAYWVLPMRASTFVIVVGLGPFTLVRAVVVVVAVGGVVAGSSDWLAWVVAVGAALAVLAVEPVVHRRWYSAPV